MRLGFLAATSLAAMLMSAAARADDTPAKGKDPAADLEAAAPGVMDLSRVYVGYTYYNKPGADADTQNSDLKYCKSIAVLGVQLREAVPSGGGLLGALINSAITAMEIKRGIAANIEDCMMVRGWRVVQVPDDEGARLEKLDQASLAEQIGAWVGADPPHGQVVRTWDNDMTKGDTIKFREAGVVTHRSLSVLALAKDLDAPATRPPAGPLPPKSARQPKGLKPDHLADVTLGPDDALVIVRLRHPGMGRGLGIELERMGPDPDTPAWYKDQRPSDLAMGKGLLFAKADGEDYAYVVPAGTWRLASVAEPYESVGLCLGAPAFEVKGGDVVYAGAFDLTADYIGPDTGLDPARKFLAAAPSLAAKLRAADWVNGYTSLCRGTYFYDYEIKGAPTRDGYVRGDAPLAKAKTDAPAAH